MTNKTLTTAERRAWKFWVSQQLGLYRFQENRFAGYKNLSRLDERRAIMDAYLKLGNSKEAKEFLAHVKRLISQIPKDDVATLKKFWSIVVKIAKDIDLNKFVSSSVKDILIQDEKRFITPEPKIPQKDDLLNEIIKLRDLEKKGNVLSLQEVYENVKRFMGKGKLAVTELIKYGVYGSAFAVQELMGHLIERNFIDGLLYNVMPIPVILGFIPLPHVTEMEIARSGKILKFRAAGSVFLANQEGGLDAIRIEGYLYRRERVMILPLLILFYFGTSRIKKIPNEMIEILVGTEAQVLSALRKMTDVSKYNRQRKVPTYEYHRTFPFICKYLIIPNCYIETMVFENKVVNGKDVISYTILLRTYTKPDAFQLYRGTGNQNYIGLSLKSNTRFYRIIEAAGNALYRMIRGMNIVIRERDWKIKNDLKGNDVTYDIDPIDISLSVQFSLFGILGSEMVLGLA